MNAFAAAALHNAKARLTVGWPLLLVFLALYGPVDATTRLVLLAAGLLLAVRTVPGNPPTPKAGTRTAKKPAPKAGERL